MEIDQEHAYAFNENPHEMDPLALVDTAIKEEIKDEPEMESENTVQHEVPNIVNHEVQNEVHHEIKIEDLDESYFHAVSNSNFPSTPDFGSTQLDQTSNSLAASSVRGLQNKDVKNKYAHSLQALRKQSDVLAQTHVEMQLEIANLKAEKAQLWKDLAAERSKEYSYVKQISDIRASCDKKIKMMRNKYERMLLNKNRKIEDSIWRTSSLLGHRIESLLASNKNCMATVDALKNKMKLQEQYKSAVEMKRATLLQKISILNNHIVDLQNKLLKEKKTGEDYLLNYTSMQNEHKKALAELAAHKSQLAEKDSVLIVLRDQIHSHKVQLENKRQAVKNQTAAAQKGLDKIASLERDIRMKDTLLEQLRCQKHKIIRKNKALVSECITLTEKLQTANAQITELKNEIEQGKGKTCDYCGL